MPSKEHTSIAISNLRIKVTGADVDYVGSVTIDAVLCDYVGIADRQLLQIRNETTGVDLWTYVIYGRRSSSVPPGTLCLNGAAAHLVSIGDVVDLTAWASFPVGVSLPKARSWDAVVHGFDPPQIPAADDKLWASMASVEIASGKVHRPRISHVRHVQEEDDMAKEVGPSVALDRDWVNEAGLVPGQMVHVVNITTGQRDVLPIAHAPDGSQDCVVTMAASGAYDTEKGQYGSRGGHYVGDIVIVMAYCTVQRSALMSGAVPTMKIAFPCERMVDPGEDELNTSWHYTTRVVWDEPKLAAGLIKLLDLKRPGLRVLDCSCGNAFPALYLVKAGINLTLSDGSPLVCQRAKERLEQELGPDHNVDVRCVLWDQLDQEYGKHAFDVIIWRGNSLPYVGGDWSAPSTSDASKAATGYRRLHSSAVGIFNALAPGGKLYVDCVPASAAKGTVIKKEGSLPASEGGDSVKLEWEFSVDEELRARKWSSTTIIDSEGQTKRTMNANLTALLVREQEIRSVLSYVGFGLIDTAVCEGEDIYQPFIANKPAVEIGYYDRQVERYRRVWNDNGKILWGLFEGVAPYVMSPETIESSRIQGKGALVGPNIAMQSFMVSKLDSINVKSILDVGCGTGRSTIDLGKHFSGADCVGCDPSGVCIDQGKVRAADEGVSDRVSFFHGTVQDLVASKKTIKSGSFSAAWSEAALCHAPPVDRADAIRAIADQLQDGGMFVLNDAVTGYAPISAAAQLHFYERLHYTGLWTGKMYLDVLESCGLHIVEYVDLTPHLVASYSALAKEAQAAAVSSGDDSEAKQTYETLAVDYEISASVGAKGELGWNLFVCKKVPSLHRPEDEQYIQESEEKKSE